MDGSASGGFSGGGLPPRPTVSTTRRRPPFVAPHPRPPTVDTNLPLRQDRSSPGSGSGGTMPSSGGNGSGSRMPSPSGVRSGGRMPSPSGGNLPRWLHNAPPSLIPRSLSFIEPHAASWDAGTITTSPEEVYEVAGDDFSPSLTPDFEQRRASSADGYFTTMMTQEGENGLELLNQQNATPSTGGKGASKRGTNYTSLEDTQLCKSWIHISNDPIIGNGQSGKTYWERITNDFHMNREFQSDRTPNSLEHRFGIILKECMKFHGFYEEVQRRHPSGVPYQEHLVEAHERYSRKSNGKKFQFEQCWLTLRHTQKFESTLEVSKRPAKSRELNLSVGTQQGNESTAQGQESSSIPSNKTTRPPGRKQSKDKLKRNEGDDDYKDMMQNLLVMKTEETKMKKERWEKDLMIEERRLKIEEDKLQWDMEQKIMFCDVSTLDNNQRAYVQAKRAKIAKAASDSVSEAASGESGI